MIDATRAWSVGRLLQRHQVAEAAGVCSQYHHIIMAAFEIDDACQIRHLDRKTSFIECIYHCFLLCLLASGTRRVFYAFVVLGSNIYVRA